MSNVLKLPAPPPAGEVRFDGEVYEPARDDAAWTGQQARIRWLMADGGWRTVAEVSAQTGIPPASASAQLRHARKERFGALRVDRQLRAGTVRLYEYRMGPHDPDATPVERGGDAKQTIIALRARIRELEAQVSALIHQSEVAQ